MTQTAATERITTADSATLAFSRQGSGDPLLMVHGTIGSAEGWALLTPHLAARFTVVTMDRRGRGASTDGDAEYSLDLDAADVASVVGAIGGRVHLFGHSYGALIALLAAARSPDVRSLVLYEPPLAMHRLSLSADEIVGPVEEALRAGDPAGATRAWLETAVRIGLFRPEEATAIQEDPATWDRFVAAVPTVPREARPHLAGPAFREAAGRIRVPVLILAGEKTSAPFIVEGLAELEDALPQVRREIIPGQQHMAVAFAPEALAERIASFLATVD